MIKRWILVISVVLIASAAHAQGLKQQDVITTTCPGAGCLLVDTAGAGTMGVQITGTFVGTLQFEQTIDGITFASWSVTPNGNPASASATNTTATGYWIGASAGARQIRVRFSAYTSGVASVSTITAMARSTSLPALVSGVLPFSQGGFGFNTATTGDIFYASATNTPGKLADVAAGQVLTSGGVGASPLYSAVPQVTAWCLGGDVYAARVGTNDYGIYTGGTNCAGGTLRFDVNSAGQVVGNLASTSVPQFTGPNAPGTGISFSPNVNNVINFLISNSRIWQIDANGHWNDTGAHNVVAGGTVQGATVNAMSAYQFNGNAFPKATIGPSAPTGTTSTTLVMAGLGGAITTRTGNVQLCMSGVVADSVANDGTKVQISYGTGTAPVNGAALTGTQVGPVQQFNAANVAAETAPYGACWVVTGLTGGTAYWFDTAFAAITGGTATITQASMMAMDVP